MQLCENYELLVNDIPIEQRTVKFKQNVNISINSGHILKCITTLLPLCGGQWEMACYTSVASAQAITELRIFEVYA